MGTISIMQDVATHLVKTSTNKFSNVTKYRNTKVPNVLCAFDELQLPDTTKQQTVSMQLYECNRKITHKLNKWHGFRSTTF